MNELLLVLAQVFAVACVVGAAAVGLAVPLALFAFVATRAVARPEGQALLETGVATTARVVAVSLTGRTFALDPELLLELDVDGPEGPVRATTRWVCPVARVPEILPGTSIPIRHEAGRPQRVVVAAG